MSGKQLFSALFLIAFGITYFSIDDSLSRTCLIVLVGFPALLATGIYWIVRWLRGGSGSAPVEKPTPKNKRRKALAALKREGDYNRAAILQYIDDSLRAGLNEKVVVTGLLGKGWSEAQVRAAFSAYQDMLARYPLPEKGLKA